MTLNFRRQANAGYGIFAHERYPDPIAIAGQVFETHSALVEFACLQLQASGVVEPNLAFMLQVMNQLLANGIPAPNLVEVNVPHMPRHVRVLMADCATPRQTRSYKECGAAAFILSLSPEETANGIITASAGNHGAGVAKAAAALNVKVTIVVPVTTPLPKVRNIQRYLEVNSGGGTLVSFGNDYDAAAAHAHELVPRQLSF